MILSRFKSKVIITAAIILMICMIWIMAFNIGASNTESVIIPYVKNSSHTITEFVEVEVEKSVPIVSRTEIIEVIKPVYIENIVEVPQEVPLEVPMKLKDWDSLEQLQNFLANDDTDQRIILSVDSQGQISFSGQCEDYALQLRDRAMAQGMYLSLQALHPAEYQKWYDQPAKSAAYHAICMARIGNEFWYIEPANDRVWLAMYLD